MLKKSFQSNFFVGIQVFVEIDDFSSLSFQIVLKFNLIFNILKVALKMKHNYSFKLSHRETKMLLGLGRLT